jgi:broad specificity phosphatase PhoE
MAETLPTISLARHGETAWSLSGQHTGLTDIPLTARGERNARQLGTRLKGLKFSHVLVSPLQRARRTCELAGFGDHAIVDPDLVEWNYGEYEGKTSAQIRSQRQDWNVFRDGGPGGESPADVRARADRVIARLRALNSDALVFSSGHFLRVIGARWCRLDVTVGEALFLSTAALSMLGYEHTLESPVLRLWNDCNHVET